MSTTIKTCGMSYKLDVPKEKRVDFIKGVYPDKVDKVDKYIEDWGEDWFFEFLYHEGDYEALNKWKIMQDYKGNLAWAFITENEESFGDINFTITLSQMQEHVATIKEANLFGIGEFDPDKIKAFAIDWYNGSDCPLIF